MSSHAHSTQGTSPDAVVDRISEGVCALDDEWRFTFVNDQAAAILDFTPAELLGECIWDTVPEFEDGAVGEHLREAVATETTTRFESYDERTESWYKVRIYPDDDGVTACFYDITEERSEKLELQRKQQLFETVFAETEDALIVADTEQRITDFNPAASALFGYDASEVLGEPAAMIYADDDRQSQRRFYEQTAERGESYTVLYERADGTTFEGETLGAPLDGPDGEPFAFLVSVRDISSRVEYEEEIEARNSALQSFHDIATDGSRSVDEQIEALLELGADHLGLETGCLATVEDGTYTVEHAVGTDGVFQVGDAVGIDGDTAIPDRAEFRATPETDPDDFDHPIYGDEIPGAFVGVPVAIDGERYGALHFSGSDSRGGFTAGEETFVRLVAQWVSKEVGRRQSKQYAADSRDRLRQIIDLLPQFVFAKDRSGEYILANQALADANGMTVEAIEGATDEEFVTTKEEARQFREDDIAVIDSGEPKEIPEEPFTTADGRELTMQTTKIPYDPVDHDTDAVLGVATDITERKAQEEELEETTQRLNVALEGTNTGIWELDLETEEVTWTDSMDELFGIEPGTFEGTFEAFADRVHPDDLPAVEETLEAVAEGDETVQTEYRIQLDDGTERWVEARAELRERGDRNRRLVGIITDISDRASRDAELELKSAAIESAIDGIAILDGDEYVYMNQAHADIFEYEPEELLGSDWRRLYDETEIERLETEVFPTLGAEGEWHGETLGRKRDGTPVYQDIGLSLLDSGELICTNRDITEQKEREQKLQRQRTQIRALFDKSPDEIVIHDEHGTVIDANETIAENLGVDRETLLSMNVAEFEDGIDKTDLTSVWSELDSDETLKIEGKHRRQNGEVYPVEVWVNRIELDSEKRFIAVSRDITEREQREAELRELNERLDLAVEGANIGIWDWDMQSDTVQFNEQWASMLGHSLAEVEPTLDAWEKRVHPADMPAVEDTLNAHVEGETELYDCEHRMRTKDGEWKWIRDVGKVVERTDGEPTRAVGIHLDISDQKATELSLEEERDMFAQGPAVVFKWRNEAGWPVEYVSENVTETLGYTPEQLQSGEIAYTDLIHEDDRERVEREVRSLTDGTTGRFSHEPYRMVTASGETRWVTDNTKIIRNEGEITQYLGYLIDITEQKRLEQSLRDSEQSLRKLTEIASDTEQSFEEKLATLLELGTDRLDTSFGFLNRIDRDTQHVVKAVGDHPQIQTGATAPNSETYCRKTLQEESGVLGLHDAVAAGWADDPAYEQFDLGCYIGGTVVVDGDQYGTLCFADHDERAQGFDDTERAFVELLVQWVSYELASDSFEEKLRKMNEMAQQLMKATSREEIASIATESTKSVLDMPLNGVWWHDESSGQLRPECMTAEAREIFPEQPTFEKDSSLAYDAFESSDVHTYGDLARADGLHNEQTVIESETIIPLGGHGIMTAGSTEPRAFSETDLNLLEVLSATVEAALTRAQREETLRETQEKLKQSNEELEQFAYAASHDLQEPLRTVSSYLTLLERRYSDELDEEAMEFIDFAVDGADRMRDMIQALLAYSRVDTQGHEFQAVPASTLFDRVTANLARSIEETEATVSTPESPVTIAGDESQLVQLFQNLTENAIKYNEGEPRVDISLTAREEMVTVEVTDNGIGFESDQAGEIFEVFQRLHTREEFPGTGIGLSICRKIVDRHGGEIGVESEPGEGSTFSVTLPRGEDDDE